MRKQIVILILPLLLVACGGRKNHSTQMNEQVNRQPVSMEDVKKQLCYQHIFDQKDTIRCPDSIWIFQLQDTTLYLAQSFYGSGYGNGIWVNLVKLESYNFTILDSLFWCNADDLLQPENIVYNDTLDWFYYVEEGGGTNHYSETKHVVRVENNKLVELISIPLYVSDMNPEVSPMTYTSLKTTEIETTQKRIVVKARFEEGIVKNDQSKMLRSKEDITTFEYSDSTRSFIWIKSTNTDFKDFWTGKIGYDGL